jgi:hypothetical protein
MARLIKGLWVLGAACAGALLLGSFPLAAAPINKDGAFQASKPKKMKNLLAEGFLIRTTVLVPPDAVTRQLCKVSSDAMSLALQKETAIAVCYYTLKAYVKESLTDTPPALCSAKRRLSRSCA